MVEWLAIEQWQRCVEMARPGIIFEIRNAEGLSLFTPCGALPPPPFDWKSPPLRFRVVAEKPAIHSAPMPTPPKSR